MGALPVLGEGHPIFDDQGALVGLFALRLPGEQVMGYALMTDVLARFFKPATTERQADPFKLEVLGGGRQLQDAP
jgi:hypothetical protein